MKGFITFLTEIAPIKRGFPKTVKTGPGIHLNPPDTNFDIKSKKLKLSADQEEAISRYTHDSSYNINHSLRTKNKLEEPTHSIEKHLSSAIKSHTTNQDMYVYHSNDSLPNLHHIKTKKPIILTHKGYTSTSLSHKESEKFSADQDAFNQKNKKSYSHVMKIHVPEGSHAADISNHSKFKTEREVLLHKNIKIAVHPKPTFDNTRGLVTWHANLIHDGIKPTRHAK